MKARIPNQGGNSQAAMMKKIQDMQAEMARTQAEVEEAEYSASAGGGAVEVTVSGAHEIKSINMQPDVVDPEDIETLQDLVMSAFNEAIRVLDEESDAEMQKLTGGVSIPGLF